MSDTAWIRIRGVSAYPRLNGPKTEEWIRILAIDTARPKLLHGGRGGTARLTGGGHGLAVEEGRGGAPRLLAHPAAFFSSRSGTSAEGAAGRKTEESAPAAMAELAIFLHTSLALPAE